MTTYAPRKKRVFIGDGTRKTLIGTPTVADIVQLMPPVLSAEVRNVTHKKTFLDFTISRSGVDVTQRRVAFVVWLAKFDVGTSNPTQVHDPLSQNALVWADSDIMYFSGLPVPPIVLVPSTDAAAVSGEVMHVQHEVSSMKNFNRANHGVCLQIAADASANIVVDIVWRTLYLV